MIIRDYAFAGLFLLFGITFVSGALIFSWMLRPRDPHAAKTAPYECGEVIKGSSRVRFNASYYLVALIFVIFDIEVLFLVPWAVVFRSLGLAAYLEMMLFFLILVFGLVYASKKETFTWQ